MSSATDTAPRPGPATPAGEKIEELESIRGLAAMLVVLFHIPAWNPALHELRFIQNSYYMVDLFFVLSGFVMYLNYGNRLHTAADLARFQFLRLGRLYPVHVLFLLLAVLASAASWIGATLFGLHIPNGTAFKDATVGDFIKQLLLLHSLGFANVTHSFNGPSWSISVEFYTYLLFGWLCLISLRTLRLCTFVALACAALWLLSLGAAYVGSYSEILQCLAGYFLGCLVAALVAHLPRALPSGTVLLALAAMIGFLCLRVDPQFAISIFFLSALLVLAVVGSREGFTKRLLRQRALKFLGLLSYSIYMSHSLILWVCNQFVRVVLHRPEALVSGISTPQLSLLGALLWCAIAIASTLLVSTWVFYRIEDPLRLKSKELARRYWGARGGPLRAAIAQNRE
jgi:peptidoglycan/LPS O-acetylase OafA/YrhL